MIKRKIELSPQYKRRIIVNQRSDLDKLAVSIFSLSCTFSLKSLSCTFSLGSARADLFVM